MYNKLTIKETKNQLQPNVTNMHKAQQEEHYTWYTTIGTLWKNAKPNPIPPFLTRKLQSTPRTKFHKGMSRERTDKY